MSGLILKDLLNLKRNSKFLFFFIFLYLGIAVLTENASFFTGIIIIFASMLPLTSLAHDEKSGFSKFALTMPVSKADIVISKYLLSLFFFIIAIFLSFLCNLFIGDITFYENLVSISIITFISFMLISISLPIVFNFGVEKGRVITFAIIMLLGIASSYSRKLISNNTGTFQLNTFFNMIFDNYFLLIGLLALMLIIFVLSTLISISIYNKKEF